MMALLAFALACTGFAALALAMDRHHRQVWQRPASGRQRVLLRVLGTVCLGASLVACIAYSGWSVGIVLWLGLLSAAVPAVALVLTYQPRVLAVAPWRWKAVSGVLESVNRERS